MERSCKMFPTYFSSVQQYTWGMIMLIKYKTIKVEHISAPPLLFLFTCSISGSVRIRSHLRCCRIRRRNHRNRIRNLRYSSCSAYPEFLRW